MRETDSLTPKQEAFVNEYLVDLNATQAAIRAGYSQKTASEQAARLLTNVKVSIAVKAAMDKRAAKTGITAERVLSELALIGFSNMLDYVKPRNDGFVEFDFSALTREQAAAIQEVTVDSYEEHDPAGEDDETRTVKKVKFRLLDKRAALVDIGRHLGMFVEKHEHTGKDGGPIQTEEIAPLEAARLIAFALEEASRSQTQH